MPDVSTVRDRHVPADMVRWYAPGVLFKAAGRVAVSTVLGGQLDRRLLRPMPAAEVTDFSHREHLVLDFVADTGDGWNSTYAVAYWATRPILRVQGLHGRAYELPRAGVFVFGGDQVYPTPSRAAYEQRLVRPYECALDRSEAPHPVLFAVPGNHDWYDSLADFTKLFLDKRWFCGWQIHQRASYFAARLPHDWWLVGVDVQLGSDIDAVQVDYFRALAARMGPNARIILCTAEPHWVHSHELRDPDARARRARDGNLAFLQDKIFGRKIRVFLSGDLHHYRRHSSPDGQIQRITAGGGGAFLHPTHVHRDDPLDGGHGLRCAFPDAATSRRLAWRNLAFPIKNPTFGAFTGLLYLLVGWNLLGALPGAAPDFSPVFSDIFVAPMRSPWAATWIVLMATGFVLFADARRPQLRVLAGLLHAAVHLLAALGLVWLSGQLGLACGLAWGSGAQLLLGLAVLFLAGWLVSSLIMGAYLLIAINGFGRHCNDAFSSLRVEDYKHFLRLHIRRDGALVIYPIGLPRVPRRWRKVVGAAPGEPKVIPDDPHPDTRPRLIEPPIVVGPG